jgi:imidazolonepropionase-like amidohydrolase
MKAVTGSRLVDANGVVENPVVLIDGEKIVDVGSNLKIPSDANVIDASGCILMPGIVDCHVHFTGSAISTLSLSKEPYETRVVRASVEQTKKLTDAGILGVMDTGGMIGLTVRNAVNAGIVSGPRVKAAGRYLSPTSGHGDTHYLPIEWVEEGRSYGWGTDGRIADGVPDCLKAVREQMRMSVDFVKLCTSGGGGSTVDPAWVSEFNLEEITAMCHEAHSWRRKVMAHCYYPEALKRSIKGGVDIITHGNMINNEIVSMMKEKGTMVVPTMSVYERIIEIRKTENVSEVYENMYPAVRRVHNAGLTLAIGTDTMGGIFPFGGSSYELQLYVEKVGLKPIEALKIGTINGYKVMGLDTELGTIEKGKLADFIAVAEDPLEDIKCLQEKNNIKLSLINGESVKNIL